MDGNHPLPLWNVTAFVLGTGPDLPADRLGRLEGYFTIGVNRIWRMGFVPAVSFWIDAGVYEENPIHFDRTLCVCDRSAAGRPEHIGLPMRAGPLPGYPNPNYLHHLANAGAAAALWAVAMGCYPVILLGMGGGDDGRGAGQLEAMRRDLRRLLAMRYAPPGAHHPALWAWDGPAEFDENMNHCHVQPARAGEMVAHIREFFSHGPI